MRNSTDIFARVYNRVSKSIREINIKSVRINFSKVMDLFLGIPSFKALIEDGKNMISLLKDYKTGEYRDISWATIVVIILAFIYLVSPLDILPDIIPILGLLDDVVILRLALAFIQDDLEQYVHWKRNSHIEDAELIDENSDNGEE